jgi:hypothetical protein
MAVVLSEGAAKLICDGEMAGPLTLQFVGFKNVKEGVYR